MGFSAQQSRRRGLRLLPIVAVGLILLFRYFTTETFVNSETGEAHKVALSVEQEAALGLSSYQEVLSQSRVIESGPEVDMVKRVAHRLTQVVPDSARNFDWRVSVVDSPQVNAFCLPGGKIVVYTGILPVAQNEAGLATVLGHEIAHATARHGAQRVFQQQSLQIALSGARGALGDMSIEQQRAIMGLLGAGAQYGLALPFSRDHELEADRLGLHYMARAGYDPRESVAFWKRMMENAGDKPPEIMSTHPADSTRISQLEELLPEAEAEYQQQSHRASAYDTPTRTP
ncbi:MAG: M48 family metallopeptidase [Kiritimatiellae bacterium]|nr:M48 family metallopeptidase [Kiritimatiellia bacterium]